MSHSNNSENDESNITNTENNQVTESENKAKPSNQTSRTNLRSRLKKPPYLQNKEPNGNVGKFAFGAIEDVSSLREEVCKPNETITTSNEALRSNNELHTQEAGELESHAENNISEESSEKTGAYRNKRKIHYDRVEKQQDTVKEYVPDRTRHQRNKKPLDKEVRAKSITTSQYSTFKASNYEMKEPTFLEKIKGFFKSLFKKTEAKAETKEKHRSYSQGQKRDSYKSHSSSSNFNKRSKPSHKSYQPKPKQ